MAETSSSPLAAISFNLCTPVVVSSLTPWQGLAIHVHLVLSVRMKSIGNCKLHLDAARVVRARWVWQLAVLGVLFVILLARVDLQRAIAAIITEHVAAVGAWSGHHQLIAPPVLRKDFALP